MPAVLRVDATERPVLRRVFDHGIDDANGFVMRTSQHLLGEVRRARRADAAFAAASALIATGSPLALLIHADLTGADVSKTMVALWAAWTASASAALLLLANVRERVRRSLDAFAASSFLRQSLAAALARGASDADLAHDLAAVDDLRAALSAPRTVDLIALPLLAAALAYVHPAIGIAAIVTSALALLVALGARNGRIEPRRIDVPAIAPKHLRPLGLATSLPQHLAAGFDLKLRSDAIGERRLQRAALLSRGVALTGTIAMMVILMRTAGASELTLVAAFTLTALQLTRLWNVASAMAAGAAMTRAAKRLAALADVTPAQAAAAPDGPVSVEDVLVVPTGRTTPTLTVADLCIGAGEAVAISGAAAAGKSTLAALLAGAIHPQRGAAVWGGLPLAAWHTPGLAPLIGYLPAEPQLLAGSVSENIARFSPASPEAIERAARIAGVHDLLAALPDAWASDVGAGGDRLSTSERRAVAMARAMFGAPSLVVLDQPETGLGTARALSAIVRLRAAGVTTVFATNDPRLLAEADRVVQLDAGRIAAIRTNHRTGHPIMTAPPQSRAAVAAVH